MSRNQSNPKKQIPTVFFLFFVSLMSLNAQWARTYGGGEGDEWSRSIQQTNDGGYILTGYTSSFGTWVDLWILKLDIDGFIEWEKTYGGIDTYADLAYSIQQTTDNGYIVAGYTMSFGAGEEDFWILKLASNGDIEWQKVCGGDTSDRVLSIQQTTDNGYIVAGFTFSFGAGGADFWILKLAFNGDVEWQKTYGGDDHDLAYSIQQTTDSGYIVAGYTSLSWDNNNFWVLKLFSTGDIEWQKTYGGDNHDIAYSIQQTTDSGYIVAGYTFSFGVGGADFWILKLFSTGDVEWQKTYGGNSTDKAYSIQQTDDGGYIVEGETSSFGAGGTDILLLKLYPDGDIHSSCGFTEITNATITDTSIFPIETFIIAQDIDVPLLDTTAFPQDSEAIVTTICEVLRLILTISTTAGGTTDPEPDTYTYYEGTEVTITATPDENYRFKEWTGDVLEEQEKDNPLTIIMDSDKSVTANFIRQYTLTIVAGTGGTTDPIPDTHTHDSGTEITITAIPDENYRFLEWTGDVPEGYEIANPLTITVDSNKTITANFIQQHTLSITAGEGGTTNPVPSVYIYDVGAEVSITAVPDENYRFTGWAGDVTGTDNPLTIIMDSDKSVTANFIRQYSLTIVAGTGGITDPSSGSYIHDSGTEVSVTAIPDSGRRFTGWTGDATGTTNPIIITMDSDKSVTASFEVIPTPPEPEPKPKKGCFIATAAYGSSLHPHVDILRDFRDQYLVTNGFGRKLVEIYYGCSPPIANVIAKNKLLKIAVRIHIRCLVAFAYLIVH